MLAKCIIYWPPNAAVFHDAQTRLYHEANVDALIRQYKEFEKKENTPDSVTIKEWFAAKQESLKHRFAAVQLMYGWKFEKKRIDQKARAEGRAARVQFIRIKVAAMQPEIAMTVVKSCPSYQNQLSKWEPMSEQAWKILKPKLITEAKALRIESIIDGIERKAKTMGRALYEGVLTLCPSFRAEQASGSQHLSITIKSIRYMISFVSITPLQHIRRDFVPTRLSYTFDASHDTAPFALATQLQHEGFVFLVHNTPFDS